MFLKICRMELCAAFRHRGELLNPLWFFLIVITLFPLGMGPEPQMLARIAPGVVWVVALPLAVLAKILAHWLVAGLPLLLLSPLAALLLGIDFSGWQVMAATLLPGTLTLSFIGAPAVALTVGLRRGGVLLSLLMLPLTIPLLIFATAAMDAGALHLPVSGYLALLGALLAASATLSPFITAAALRISLH